MLFDGKEVPFPAVARISFNKVIENLEKQAKETDKSVSGFAKDLLKEVNQYPELREGFDDFALLEKYKKPINKLCRTLFPEILLTNEIKAITPPFYFQPFYT